MRHGSWGAGPLSPVPPAHPSPSEGLDWALPRKESDCHPRVVVRALLPGGQVGAPRSSSLRHPCLAQPCTQQDSEPATGSDLSRCVLGRPGVTSLQHVLGEGCPAQHAMAVGYLLLTAHRSGHVGSCSGHRPSPLSSALSPRGHELQPHPSRSPTWEANSSLQYLLP